MERKIKFRAKHVHSFLPNKHLDGSWVYGYLANKDYIYSKELEGEFLIDQKTIGQCVGFEDCKGIEMFEGDIIQRNILGEKVIGEIIWSDLGGTGFCLKVKIDCGSSLYPIGRGRFDDDEEEKCNDIILGNIYDNPKLIQ